MSAEYDKCWYCGSSDIQPDDRGSRSGSCGTTYNPVGKLAPAIVVDDTFVRNPEVSRAPIRTRRPVKPRARSKTKRKE